MFSCELAAYVLGGALIAGGLSLAMYELGRRRAFRKAYRASRRFDPDAETAPEPRKLDPETTIAAPRESIADMVAAEGRALLADAEALRKSGRFKTPPPDPKDP